MMMFKNNLKKKLSIFLGSLLIVLSSLAVGISAYFISKVSVKAAFTVDIYRPQLTVETVLGNSESAPIYVSEKIVTIKGSTADTGSGVDTLTVNGTEVSVNYDGNWSTNVTLLDNEVTTITVVSIDKVGKETKKVGYIYYDNIKPTLNVSAPTGNSVDNPTYVTSASYTVKSTANDVSGISSFMINGTETALLDGSYSRTITLTAGANTITIVAKDGVGNTAIITRYVYYDTANPLLSVTAPTGTSISSPTYTTSNSITVSGSASDSQSGLSFVKVNGTVVTVGSDGKWSIILTLSANTTTKINVVATDKAGKSTTVTRYVYYSMDNTPPTLTITTPTGTFAEPTIVTTDKVTVSGTASDSGSGLSSVTVNGTAVTIGSDGTWSTSVSLIADELTAIIVKATDKAGMSKQNVVYACYDISGPDIEVPLLDGTTSTFPAYVGSNPYPLEGMVSDPSGIAYVEVTGTTTVRATLNSDGSWVADVNLVYFSNQEVTVTTVDKSGNSSSVTGYMYYDMDSPSITITTPVYGSTENDYAYSKSSVITISGMVNDTDLSTFTVGGKSVTVDASGNFSIVVSLSSGMNKIELKATDATGLICTRYLYVKCGSDSVPPSVMLYNSTDSNHPDHEVGWIYTITGMVADVDSDIDYISVTSSDTSADVTNAYVNNKNLYVSVKFTTLGSKSVMIKVYDKAGNVTTRTVYVVMS